MAQDNGTIRQFASGATRDTAVGKLSYDRFNSPRVERRYCQYMEEHRQQSDGSLREPDNWKKGIDVLAYRGSLGRHTREVEDMTNLDDGHVPFYIPEDRKALEDALCAIIFNAKGMLFEITRPLHVVTSE